MSEKSQLRLCPVLLAGGRSRRMGRDKAQLQLPNGQTLLQRAESLLRGLNADGLQFLPPLVSGDRPGGIADRVPDSGPLGGIYSVAEYLREEKIPCDALLAIPVDMPLLQARQLRDLCVAGSSSGASAACFGRCYLPLWLRLDGRSRACLRELVRGEGEASVRELLGRLGGRQLEMPPGDWHINVNRAQDFSDLFN